MCRFVIYKGRQMRMSDLLTESSQSLIHQSFGAREREEPLNGDGFGVGWYGEEPGTVPGVFNSIRPAWSNRNLRRLAARISSHCFFAHVRAATPGMSVSELNCHPFLYGNYLWMHNGHIASFQALRRKLLASLPDALFNFVQGNTDTELSFAVFLQELQQLGVKPGLAEFGEAMQRMLARLTRATRDAGIDAPSFYNFAFTDGENIVSTRYVDNPGYSPETLYTSTGDRFAVVDARYRMQTAVDRPRALIVASEPLTDTAADWQPVPHNHLLLITPDLRIEQRPINV